MTDYQRGKLIYEGKASRLYEAADLSGVVLPDLLIIERKDDITKLDGKVRDSVAGKGACTNRISNRLFRYLEENGILTHFVEELSDRETLITKVEPFPLEVIVRNIATGSLCKRLPIKEGTVLPRPIVEFDYKSDEYGDPMINHDQAIALGIVDDDGENDLYEIEAIALDVNALLSQFFLEVGIILVDFKLEFGRIDSGHILVIDEISPDTCRFWDAETHQKLDKDVFRQGMGTDATASAYAEVMRRLFNE